MKSGHHVATRHAVTMYPALSILHVKGPERVGWYEPGIMAIRLSAPTPEPETTDSGLYTDLQTAQAVAEQMRQLIDVYRLRCGEFHARPQPRN